MRKVSYVITVNGVEIPSATYTSFEEVINVVKTLNEDADHTKFGYKTILTPFDPDDTPEKNAAAKAHAEKARAAILRKKYEEELKHAPAYINNSGVGAT